MATRDPNKLRKLWENARNAVELAKERMATRANKKGRDPYRVGDQVLLSTKNLKLKGYDFPKLCPLFVGPLQVLEMGANTVRLNVPGSLSDNFNINRIRLYHYRGRFHQEGRASPAPFQRGRSNHPPID